MGERISAKMALSCSKSSLRNGLRICCCDYSGWRVIQALSGKFRISLPGVFRAGDIHSGSIKRVASAVHEGSMAVQFVTESSASRSRFRITRPWYGRWRYPNNTHLLMEPVATSHMINLEVYTERTRGQNGRAPVIGRAMGRNVAA